MEINPLPEPPSKRVSSRDVARHAGVSQTTVSFVLSGRQGVSIPQATRERVMRSAAELGYLPSHLASGLSRGHTQAVGVVLLSSVYPWVLFSGMQAELAKADYVPILLSPSWTRVYSRGSKIPVGYASDEVSHIYRLIEQHVDGLVYYSIDPTHTAECLIELTRRKIPVVLVDNDNPDAGVDFVGCDDELVGRLGARHLLSLNRRSIGLARYAGTFIPATRRIEAFKDELERAGRGCCEFVAEEDQLAQLTGVLSQCVTPPAAVFACSDMHAAMVFQAARKLGWRIPQDLAVMGVGGFNLSLLIEPPITTVHRQAVEIGRKAVTLLLERINGYDGPPRRIQFEPYLEVRGSTVAPE